MRAAVIGANSYIARNLIRLNQLERYAEMSLYDVQPAHVDGAAEYRQLDLARQEDVQAAVSNCDAIYFFVGKTGTLQGFNDPDTFLEVNEKCLLRLLNACRAVKTKAKIVFPSTRLVYHGSERALREDAQKQFLTPYAIQKYAGEQYLEMYRRLYGVNYCILRIGVPYGTMVQPVSSFGTLDAFAYQVRTKGEISIYGDGTQRRTFTYIEDLCRMLWKAGLNEECVNDVYNVGGEDYSIGEIAHRIAAAHGASVCEREWPDELRRIESGSTVFDSSKLQEKLGETMRMNVCKWMELQKNGALTKDEKSSGGGYRNRIIRLLVTVSLLEQMSAIPKGRRRS